MLHLTTPSQTENISLFIYEDDKYTKYIELNFGNLTIYPMEMKETIDKYQKMNIKIQDTNCDGKIIRTTHIEYYGIGELKEYYNESSNICKNQ